MTSQTGQDRPGLPAGLESKIELYLRNRLDYERSTYKEARARREFIDPLLVALGWDVDNTAGAGERFKAVVLEASQDVEGRKRAPDYALRVGGTTLFYVEAKRPSTRLSRDAESALQARRYAWSASLPIVVLTNFAELAVYNGSVRPKATDGARVARLQYYTVEQYADSWAEISGLLAHDAAVTGDFDRFVDTVPKRGGRDPIDKVFLADLEQAREVLANNFALHNPRISDGDLTAAVQLTLDRLVFLRICEDRGLEPYGTLQKAATGRHARKGLQQLYEGADDRYNSGLFHFDKEAGREPPDLLTPALNVSDDLLRDLVDGLYPPRSPYAFAVMPIDILGQVYESLLGKSLSKVGNEISLIVKPEVRKSGGVYYTPEWLTRAVVAATLDPLLAGRDPKQFTRANPVPLRVLDPACGSGSFLVQTYRHLLDWYFQQYAAQSTRWSRSRPPRIEKGPRGAWRLTLSERKRLLLAHVFGVDIDPQAVEVTKLSLLLVVLEGQTAGDVVQLSLFGNRALPDLDNNVRCGNSLVGSDFLTDAQLAESDTALVARVRPFDWDHWAPAYGRFDAVVGNPPWLMAGYSLADTLDYLRQEYSTYTGKADLYYLFLERTLKLLKDGGRGGIVVPNKMFTTRAAKRLRALLGQDSWVDSIIDFGTEKVFLRATNYTSVIYLKREPVREEVSYKQALVKFGREREWKLSVDQLTEDRWDTNPPASRTLWDELRAIGDPLSGLLTRFGNGVQSGADPLLVLSRDQAKASRIERVHLRPILRGRDVRAGALSLSTKYLVFPYRVIGQQFRLLTLQELKQRPGLYAYLETQRARLAQRRWFGKTAEQLHGEWWALMYLDARSSFTDPHLLTPSLSNRGNFARGDGRLFLTGTAGVTGAGLRDPQDADYLLPLLNSRLLSTYVIAHSSSYSGAYFKFSARYIEHVPIVPLRGRSGLLARKRLTDLWRSRESVTNEAARNRIDDRIDDVVARLYGVDDEAVAAAAAAVTPLRESPELDWDDISSEDLESRDEAET